MLSKAQNIDELEDSLPAWAIDRVGHAWYPRYLHVLKVTAREESISVKCGGSQVCFAWITTILIWLLGA